MDGLHVQLPRDDLELPQPANSPHGAGLRHHRPHVPVGFEDGLADNGLVLSQLSRDFYDGYFAHKVNRAGETCSKTGRQTFSSDFKGAFQTPRLDGEFAGDYFEGAQIFFYFSNVLGLRFLDCWNEERIVF